MTLGDTSLQAELDALLESDEQTPPSATQQQPTGTTPPATPAPAPAAPATELKGKEGAQVMAARIRESTDKARLEEREAVAKAAGFNSYDELLKSQHEKIMKDQGLDPELVKPVLKKLMDEDPRVKELENLKAKQIEEFGRQQLSEITTLTGGKITSLDQLSSEVIELWKTKGSLKGAYMYYHGHELTSQAAIAARSAQTKTTTAHLQSPAGSAPGSDDGLRPLTNAEKAYFKEINPHYTDAELSAKRIKK